VHAGGGVVDHETASCHICANRVTHNRGTSHPNAAFDAGHMCAVSILCVHGVCTCVHVHANRHTNTERHTQTQTHTRAHTHTHAYTHVNIHTHICTHTKAHTHEHTHAHMHTYNMLTPPHTNTCANAHLASVPVHPRVDEVCAGARTIRAPVSRRATWSRCHPFFAPTAVRCRRPLPGPAWTPPGYRSCKMGRRRPAPVPFEARPAPEGGTRAPPCLPHAFQIENWSANFRRDLSLTFKDTCALRFPQWATHSKSVWDTTNSDYFGVSITEDSHQ